VNLDFAKEFGDLFELERLVAQSDERVLFLVRDRVLKRRASLRVHLAPEAASRAWFLREAEVLAMLDHPSVRHVYSAGQRGAVAYRVGNWIEGESLAEAVERGPRPMPAVLSIGRELLYALDHAHVRGVVMRRILPTTILVDVAGRAVITDLRFANRVLDVVPKQVRRDDDTFVAPEVRDGSPGDPGADIYAIGAVLYYAITGVPPADKPKPVLALRPETPRTINDWVMRALESNPRRRYFTAAEMLSELGNFTELYTEPSAAGPTVILPDSPQWERRLRRALGDDYALIAQIGSGSFGHVYRVRDLRLNREVAMKVLDPRLTQDAAIAEGFQREAQLAASLKHPNIVSIFDIDARMGLLWYTMELIEGHSLAQLVKAERRLSVTRTVELIAETLFALEHAHQQRLVHRDIKPENLLVDPAGRLHVTDFGLALALPRGRLFGGATSRSGTPQFAAPEQLAGGQVDQRTDLFSLGAVGYFALLGEPPFSERTADAVMRGQIGFTLPDIGSIRPDVPGELEQVLRKACAFDPAQRFPHAEAFRDALESAGFQTGERPVVFEDERTNFLARLRRLFE
jgi:serine/threonine-protein kinase